jgi:hypothetical protein
MCIASLSTRKTCRLRGLSEVTGSNCSVKGFSSSGAASADSLSRTVAWATEIRIRDYADYCAPRPISTESPPPSVLHRRQLQPPSLPFVPRKQNSFDKHRTCRAECPHEVGDDFHTRISAGQAPRP